ncbi:MAG: AAA family ATPase [Clostridia bacterium]|nr:AAA family ATPase [Clostridia bacterium]
MRINKISIINFGSYEGVNTFETKADNNHNIVLIGGKNGAGKTTLFTAMRVCLYGFLSMGYKNANSYYIRAITKMINNNAKMSKPCSSAVSLEIELNNGRGIDVYTLSRSWILDDDLSEEFSVVKNDSEMDKEEIADFEKYILSLIPPELFNLYFFDGERIADFFLKEGSNARIKDAFLTLCGYDTFDIMRRNFKRISAATKGKSRASLEAYIDAKELAKTEQETFERIHEELLHCATDIENCSAEISSLDREYTNSGGITQEDWNQKIYFLKDEERKRENWNALLRKWANDVIPFIMVSSILSKVKEQIEKENSDNKRRNFIDILRRPELSNLIGDKRDEIERIVLSLYGTGENRILDLSFEQSANLMATVSDLLAFDRDKIAKVKQQIKKSINMSAKVRKELEQSSITSVQEYMRKRAELFEKKSQLLDQRINLEQLLQQQKDAAANATSILTKAQSTLEEEIKRESMGDISARAIIMLDKLQSELYRKQIEKVETSFRFIINMLMRKSKFIDEIHIDESFNIHVFRNEEITGHALKEIIVSNSEDQIAAMFGDRAINILTQKYGAFLFGVPHLVIHDDEKISIPIEIDKESFSNGEKQIFIMALYYSLVQLGKHEIPFVIDTPFARIDTEHRYNIAKYFFSELKGQVFILSTNEEITTEHVQMLQDKILAQYLLENTDNKKTVVVKDAYFEV